jgi:hypothetical protein
VGERLSAWEVHREAIIDNCHPAHTGERPPPYWMFDAIDPEPPERNG